MGVIADPNFQGVVLKRLKQEVLLYDSNVDFRTGIPHPAFDLTGKPGTTESPFYFDRIKVTRSTLCRLWYRGKKLKIESPQAPIGYATLKYLFKASGDPDPSEHITYIPGANSLPPGRNSFFYPIVWNWSMDGVLDESGVSLNITLSADIGSFAGGGGTILTTDGEKLFPNLFFSNTYDDADGISRFVHSDKNFDTDTQVGTIKILGDESPIWSSESGAPDYGDVTVTIEEEW